MDKILDWTGHRHADREAFFFRPSPVSFANEDGIKGAFPCITLYERSTGIPAAYPRLERWYTRKDGTFLSEATLIKKASSICSFMNYLLWETECSRICDINPDILKGFVKWFTKTLDEDYRDPTEWRRGIGEVFDFLGEYNERNCHALPFLYSTRDLYTTREKRYYGQNKWVNSCREYKLYGVKKPPKTEKKYRYLPEGYLALLLFEARKHDPMLALPIAMQAYGGLREGEVPNVAHGGIHFIYGGFGRLGGIEVGVNESAPFAKSWNGKREFASIKRFRTQRIYDDFLDEVKMLYEAHEGLLASLGASTEPGSPMFVNRRGGPLTEERYTERVKSLFYDHFLPSLKKLCMHEGTWASNAPFIEAYEKGFPGCHAFRHWMTMYLLTTAGLSPEQVAMWRGDRDPNSMYDYVHMHQDAIGMYRTVAYTFQRSIFEEIL